MYCHLTHVASKGQPWYDLRGMGWRSRFEPARTGVRQLGERAKRIANIRALGDQVARVRRIGLRGEFIVPLIALLILGTALGLSALSSSTPAAVVSTPTASNDVAMISPTQTASPTVDAGYPAPSASAPFDTSVPDPNAPYSSETAFPSEASTSIAEGGMPESGYPSPDDGPTGVDPAPDGGVPPPGDLAPTAQTPANPPVEYPTPALIQTPVPVPPSGGNGDSGSGYPPPDEQPQQPVNPPRSSSPAQPAPTDESEPVPGDDGSEVTPEVTPATPPTKEATTPAATATPIATPIPPTPTARPAKVISGNTRWTAANGPIALNEDHVVPAGSTLTIDPSVEVQLGPSVRLTVAGTLRAAGTAESKIRFVGPRGSWDGLVGAPGSSISLEHTELRQAGSTGTALSSTGGNLVVRDSLLTESSGGIVAIGSALDLRGTSIRGNAINGPVVNVRLPQQQATNIVGNTIAANTTPAGAQLIVLNAGDAAGPFLVEGNLIAVGTRTGIGVTVASSIPLTGTIRCNTFNGGTIGLQLQANRPDAAGFKLQIDSNAFAGQATFGATGTVGFNVANNWWNDPSGPADAQRNSQGRGVPVGVNLQFQPWLGERPACAPAQ